MQPIKFDKVLSLFHLFCFVFFYDSALPFLKHILKKNLSDVQKLYVCFAPIMAAMRNFKVTS